MPDDERKGRRLGDETKGRIADLASGWAVDGESPPPPGPPAIAREPSGPVRPRRQAKTIPPPPPGSAARKEMEDELGEVRGPARPAPATRPPPVPAAPTAATVPTAPSARPRTGAVPLGKRREPLDLGAVPESDKTKENRGAVGIKHEGSTSLTTNAASGTIGDTPSPVFDRAAIAAGQKGALASDKVERSGAVRAPTSAASSAPNRSAIARTPAPSAVVDQPSAKLGIASAQPVPAPFWPSSSDASRAARPGEPARTPTAFDDTRRAAAAAGPDDSGELIAPTPPVAPAPPVAPTPPPPRAAAKLAAPPLPGKAVVVPAALDAGDEDPADAPAEPPRPDPTFDDAAEAGERGDPTRGDDTAAQTPAARPPGGTLRPIAALRRKRGVAGDLRYVATVFFGVRAARRELAELEARQAARQASRRHHLVTLGRAASVHDDVDHPELAPARAKLAAIEADRTRQTDDVTAADAELARVRAGREAAAQQHAAALAELDGELAAIARKLEPLEKEASGIKRRATRLREALRDIDAKIAALEARVASGHPKVDVAAGQAELATLKADRKAIQGDEPVIAAELDALAPRIAALEASRGELGPRRLELIDDEARDQARVADQLAAIGARRKVVDRAAADAEARRDKVLFALGERLAVDRPDGLLAELAPVDAIDVDLGVADRRIMELRETLDSVDRWKVARGAIYLVVILAAVAGAALGVRYLIS